MGYSMSAASTMVKRLREKGFVSVEPSALDERRKLLRVTEKGEHVRDMMDAMLKDLPGQLFPRLYGGRDRHLLPPAEKNAEKPFVP